MYFQCLLNCKYRMTRKLSLHCDVCHLNIHTWWKFENFKLIFYLMWFLFTHVILSLKNKYKSFHTYLIPKWQQISDGQWGLKSVIMGQSFTFSTQSSSCSMIVPLNTPPVCLVLLSTLSIWHMLSSTPRESFLLQICNFFIESFLFVFQCQ